MVPVHVLAKVTNKNGQKHHDITIVFYMCTMLMPPYSLKYLVAYKYNDFLNIIFILPYEHGNIMVFLGIPRLQKSHVTAVPWYNYGIR